jgi:hypothetical protein
VLVDGTTADRTFTGLTTEETTDQLRREELEVEEIPEKEIVIDGSDEDCYCNMDTRKPEDPTLSLSKGIEISLQHLDEYLMPPGAMQQ